MKKAIVSGVAVLAGIALFEVALVPGVLIGAAAVLAPRYRRRSSRPVRARSLPRGKPPLAAAPAHRPSTVPALASPDGFAIKQAIAKTITFRIIVTTLDFGTNYLIIGEVATAAGLSAFALVVAPFFYFVHEAAWNRLRPGDRGVVVALTGDATERAAAGSAMTINRALAKTITFRVMATTMDFTTNYVVVGDLLTAVGLSATGFVLGPFVYFGHEKAWEHYGPRLARALDAREAMGVSYAAS